MSSCVLRLLACSCVDHTSRFIRFSLQNLFKAKHWRDSCLGQKMSGKTERGTYKVYVGNLGNNGSKKELEREFERFGRLHDVWVARNPPGFAFVEFMEYHDAEDACKSLDGARICGERVRVEMARNRNRGGGGGGGGSRRSDYRDDRHGGGGRHYDNRGGSDRYDDRSRSPYRSPPRRGRGRSPDVDRWGGRGGRSRSRSPRRF